MVKPAGYSTITEVARGPSHRGQEPRRALGFSPGRWATYWEEDETGRNVIEGIWQRIPTRTPAGLNWPFIATTDARDASDLESNRFLYDDQHSACLGTAEPTHELSWLPEELSAVGLGERSRMRQGCRARAFKTTVIAPYAAPNVTFRNEMRVAKEDVQLPRTIHALGRWDRNCVSGSPI